MSNGNDAEVLKIELFLGKVERAMKSTFKAAVKEASARIVERTPVYFKEYPESGNTKANWNISETTPDLAYEEDKVDFDGKSTISDIRGFIQSSSVTDKTVFYLSSSAPAVFALETGLVYPIPPKYGSYNKFTHQREIRSSGGFSRQAPQGMVGITALEWPQIVNQAKEDTKR